MQINAISFGYSHPLKTQWKQGKMPELQHDFYDGSLLNKDTVTLEHLLPRSKGGKTTISNLVLTNYENNMKRSNRDIRNYINEEAARQYIEEVKKVKTDLINGEVYARCLVNRLKSLGVKLYETI